MYDPTIGRFVSEDPIGIEAGDTNYFRYVRNNPMNATDPSGLEEQKHFPPMSDRDYKAFTHTFELDFPSDPATTKLGQRSTAIAVIVEVGDPIGHSAIAIGKPGTGFDPATMEFYDFGPDGGKSLKVPKAVPGGPWWDTQISNVDDAKLSDVIRNLDQLTQGNQTHIYIAQIKEDQARKIEDYWKRTIYNINEKGDRGKMPDYTFFGGPGTYQCTTSVANSLRRAGPDVYDVFTGRAEEALHLSKIRPQDFAKTLQGQGLLPGSKARALTSTSGPNTGKQALVQIREDGKWDDSPPPKSKSK